MTMTWTAPATVLTAEAKGWPGVWTLAHAAGQAAVNLSAAPGADDDLGLTFAALDVSYALTELESALTDAAVAVPAVDLGAATLADCDTALAIIDDLLAAAESLAIELASRPDVTAPVVLRGRGGCWRCSGRRERKRWGACGERAGDLRGSDAARGDGHHRRGDVGAELPPGTQRVREPGHR